MNRIDQLVEEYLCEYKIGDRIMFSDIKDSQSASASSKDNKKGTIVKLKAGNLAVVSFDGSKKNSTINLKQASPIG